MTDKSRSSLGRALVLLVVMAGLAGVLFWQRWSIHEAARLQKETDDKAGREARAKLMASDQRFNLSLDDLSDDRLAEAKAASPRIAALRQQRNEASRWPYLLVPTPANARTSETMQEEYTRFRLRELEAYRRLTEDTGAAKSAGETFLEAYLHHVANRLNPSSDYTRLHELGLAAEAAGCRDPMFRTYFAMVKATMTANLDEARAIWMEMLDVLPKTRYPRTVLVYARMFLHDYEADLHARQQRWKEAIPAIVEWLEEEAATPEWLPSVCERLWGLLSYRNRGEKLWFLLDCLRSTKVDPYISHALAGAYYVDMAWSSRGGGWAVDVKPEQWNGFRKSLDRARTHLEYAWVLHPELPQAPERMIPIAMAGGVPDKPYFWFLRTIEARFDDTASYQSLGNALSTRWGGSRRELLTLAENCVETLRFDTAIPYRMLDMLALIKRLELDDGETLAAEPRSAAILRRFLQLRADYRATDPTRPMYEDEGRYRAEMLETLEECGLEDEATALLQSFGGKLYWSNLRKQNRPGRYLAAQRLASSGPFRQRVQNLGRQLREPVQGPIATDVLDRWDAELQSLQRDMAAEPSTDNSFPDFFQHSAVLLAQRRAYNSGDWCPLEFHPSLAGWEPYCDEWFYSAETGVTLSGRYGGTKQICLRPLVPFQPPLEVEADLEMWDPPPYLRRVGIGWSREGMTHYSERSGNLPLFGFIVEHRQHWQTKVFERKEMASVSYWEGHQSSNHPLLSGQKHHLRIKLWPNFVEYRADDAWYAVPLTKGLHPDGWLCFGEVAPATSTGSRDDKGAMQFSNIRVRRLIVPTPPAETEPLAERVAYWEARYQADPQDIVTIVGLIGVRADESRHDDVLTLVAEAQRIAPEAHRVRRWKAIALKRLRRYAEALVEFDQVSEEWSDDYPAVREKAEVRAAAPDPALRNGPMALQSAKFALYHSPGQREALNVLAAAHAEMGDFDKAIEVQQQALDAEAETADAQSAVRLELYRAHQPWRLPALEAAKN